MISLIHEFSTTPTLIILADDVIFSDNRICFFLHRKCRLPRDSSIFKVASPYKLLSLFLFPLGIIKCEVMPLHPICAKGDAS